MGNTNKHEAKPTEIKQLPQELYFVLSNNIISRFRKSKRDSVDNVCLALPQVGRSLTSSIVDNRIKFEFDFYQKLQKLSKAVLELHGESRKFQTLANISLKGFENKIKLDFSQGVELYNNQLKYLENLDNHFSGHPGTNSKLISHFKNHINNISTRGRLQQTFIKRKHSADQEINKSRNSNISHVVHNTSHNGLNKTSYKINQNDNTISQNKRDSKCGSFIKGVSYGKGLFSSSVSPLRPFKKKQLCKITTYVYIPSLTITTHKSIISKQEGSLPNKFNKQYNDNQNHALLIHSYSKPTYSEIFRMKNEKLKEARQAREEFYHEIKNRSKYQENLETTISNKHTKSTNIRDILLREQVQKEQERISFNPNYYSNQESQKQIFEAKEDSQKYNSLVFTKKIIRPEIKSYQTPKSKRNESTSGGCESHLITDFEKEDSTLYYKKHLND